MSTMSQLRSFSNKDEPGPTPSTTSSPTKKAKTDSAMMARDVAKHVPAGLPLLSSEGLYGIQDGCASTVVCGHDVLMRIIDHMKARGVPVEKFFVAAINKDFGFGGDANRHADWSVRLPVYIDGNAGCIGTFIVEGNTPFLIGRPILQALNIKIDYNSNQVSICWHGRKGWVPVLPGQWGRRRPLGQNIAFDNVTTDTYAAITNYDDLDEYISICDYLTMTKGNPPETAFLEDDNRDDDTSNFEETYDPADKDDPSAVRRPITTRIIKTMHMKFNSFDKKRHETREQMLFAHQNGKRIFWEIYSGSANFSAVMESQGWEVANFDYNSVRDFDIA